MVWLSVSIASLAVMHCLYKARFRISTWQGFAFPCKLSDKETNQMIVLVRSNIQWSEIVDGPLGEGLTSSGKSDAFGAKKIPHATRSRTKSIPCNPKLSNKQTNCWATNKQIAGPQTQIVGPQTQIVGPQTQIVGPLTHAGPQTQIVGPLTHAERLSDCEFRF